jgi:ATP-binding cassette, subfamily B, bacterial
VPKAYRNITRAFGLVWHAHAPSAIGMAAVTLVSAALPVSQAWLGKLIIDGVFEAARTGAFVSAGLWAGIQPVLPYLMLELALVTLGAAATQARTLFEHVLHARLSHEINTAIIRKALTLDLQFFEDAEFYDKLQNARREADRRALSILNSGFYALQNMIQLLSFAAVLLTFSPLIALVLFGASLPMFLAQTKYSNLNFRLLTWRAPEARRMMYFEHLLTDKDSVKEVKLFGLGETLLGRYVDLFWKFYKEDALLARRRSLISIGFGLLANLAYYGAYAWIVWRAVIGAATLGDMALYLAIFRQSQGAFQGLLTQINQLYESALFMSNLYSYLELTPRLAVSAKARAVQRGVPLGIEFRNVSFKYPNKNEWALDDVSLTIKAGEKLALVGANGAGKTTFIKLLTRLYDPDKGQILLDGIDLREYDPDSLRDAIGVIFQDFVRYQATARENVGFGQVKALDDIGRIERAAEKGGADDVIAELPERYDTMLGYWFNKGRDLSGGQWQKMALGRAFMRDADILVLDEPTSALDAQREYEIFQSFRELTAGKIAILISHRFSTVRMADRIAVIAQGKLAELGSHAELLALDGTYARLFNMQAEGYR